MEGAAEVVLKLLVDVAQRAGQLDAGIDRKTEPVGLTVARIRVLTEDDHLDLVERTGIESRENFAGRRKTVCCA